MILTQQISNHPLFPDVERHVDVTLQQANSNNKTFEFWFNIRYIKDDEDISAHFSQPLTNRIKTDNNTRQLIRDEDFNPIPNPDWDGVSEDEYDIYLSTDGWTLITTLINQPTNIAELIRQYIIYNDSVGFFNN